MPELPEVETTVFQLRRKVLQRTFLDVWTDFSKMIKDKGGLGAFRKKIKGRRIEAVYRVGKNIVFDLSGNLSLLVHQKLTGHLLYGKWRKENGKWISEEKGPISGDPMNRFIRLIFWLDNGKQLALSDLRKFAKVKLGRTEEIKKELKTEVAPDPFEMTLREFKERIKSKKGKIKQVLMDQKVVSGIGNIYSDEILFASRIHPLKEISKLKDKDFENIYKAIRKILKKAIEVQGTSISDWRTPSGEKGGFEKLIKIYRKEGKSCPRCGLTIKRIKIGGRSAHFCPTCQRID